ncbi:MAG TPA: hypothetical protein VK395_22450 [Gemmataceae bacterium]|nr:hypothetical protein [Gemmataceae bacterium]
MSSTNGSAVLPASSYTVRRLRPEDAAGVTECVRHVYGDSYCHPEIYVPEQIIKLNKSGELVSVVALDADGKVIGHYALERAPNGEIAEEGEALVVPEHRHEHLMERMRSLLEEEANALTLRGLFGRAVTNHIFTQKVHDRFGLRPCALSLGVLPRSFHNMADPLPQRMSLLLGFKFLQPPSRVVVHAPNWHKAMCARIYDQFQLAVDFREPGPIDGPGRLAVDFSKEMQEALIRVQEVGTDTAAEVSQAHRDLCNTGGVQAIILELPLAQAGTAELCRSAEEDGFFFSGIGPCFASDGDALRLQFLNIELDIGLLQIENPFARELVAYVGKERARATRAVSCAS